MAKASTQYNELPVKLRPFIWADKREDLREGLTRIVFQKLYKVLSGIKVTFSVSEIDSQTKLPSYHLQI